MAKRDNEIKESFTEKKDFQLKETKLLSLLKGNYMKQASNLRMYKYKRIQKCTHRDTRGGCGSNTYYIISQ